jgi:hypothetical protein
MEIMRSCCNAAGEYWLYRSKFNYSTQRNGQHSLYLLAPDIKTTDVSGTLTQCVDEVPGA